MTRKKRAKRAGRLEPADVLQMRMDYYFALAKAEMKKGELSDPEKVDEYLKLAQDAAKELVPYREAKAQAGAGGEEQKNYIVRMGPHFEDLHEWLLYSKVVMEKLENEKLKSGFESANERIIERFFIDGQKPPPDGSPLN